MPFVGIGVGIGRQRFASGIFAAYAARVAADGGVTEAGACVDAVSALLQTASLLLIPSGYKSGKVYSEIPTNGDGDLTFTRASTATRVNSDGEIESVATGVPRLDYSQGSCPALLLEPQRTNLLLYSEEFDNASWAKARTIVTANVEISPDGTLSAYSITDDTNSGEHKIEQIITSTTLTHSIFVKSNSGRYVQLVGVGTSWYQNFDVIDGIIESGDALNANIENYGNGWYRISAYDGGANFKLQFNLITSANSPRVEQYIGDGTNSFYIWGAQVEAGAYPTSYIPTTTATVTRIADAASKTGISSLIGQTEGTIYFQTAFQQITSGAVLCRIDDNSENNRLVFFLAANNRLNINISRGGVSADIIVITDFLTSYPNGAAKMALGYKNGDFALAINGVIVGTSTNAGAIPSMTSFRLNSNSLGGLVGQENVQSIALFPTRLSNSELAQLTTL